MMWALVLLLRVGAVGVREQIVSDHVPSWDACIQQAIPEVRVRRGLIAVRCEPSKGQGI